MSELTLTKAQLKKIKAAIKSLNDVRQELQDENPDFDINWYLEDSNNLNLMECNSHNMGSWRGEPMQGGIMHTFYLHKSSGGGW